MAIPVLTPEGVKTDDQWLTTSEAVELSGVPVRRLRSWARFGHGPEHRRVGGAILWRRSSLIEALSAS